MFGCIVCRYFLPSEQCHLSLFMVSFAVQKLLSLIRSHLFILLFSIALEDWPKKILVQFMSENVLPLFFSRSFMMSCHIFKSLNILSIFLYLVWRCVLTLLIYMKLSNTACWRGFFPIIYSYLLCWRLIDHRCVSLFLGCFVPLSRVSFFFFFCLFLNTMLFWLL